MPSNILPGLIPLTVSLSRLEPLDGNPRVGNVEAVAKSYEKFGQRKPIVARVLGRDPEPYGVIIAGNHQYAAAKRLGWTEIAVVWTEDDELTSKAYAVADNQIAVLGGYDSDALTEIIAELTVDESLLSVTGFTENQIAGLLGETVGLPPSKSNPPPVESYCPGCGLIWTPNTPAEGLS